MRKLTAALAGIAALMIALVAGYRASHAAQNDCLAAPNGAASGGQHWYYHLDRANNRKCWYLRDLGAAAATPSTAPSQEGGSPTRDARGAAAADGAPTVRPSAHTVPAPPPSISSPPGRGAAAKIDAGLPSEVSARSAAATSRQPANPASAPSAAAPHEATVWTTDPTLDAAEFKNAVTAAAEQAQPVVTDPPVRPAPAKKRAAAARETPTAAAAPVSDTASATSVAQNVLVILFAALLAGAVFAVFAILRRRKPASIPAADSGSRFGSRREPDHGLWLKWPRRSNDALTAAPLQSSLIPQQVSMTRQSAPRR